MNITGNITALTRPPPWPTLTVPRSKDEGMTEVCQPVVVILRGLVPRHRESGTRYNPPTATNAGVGFLKKETVIDDAMRDP
jgi:hypothetical protein